MQIATEDGEALPAPADLVRTAADCRRWGIVMINLCWIHANRAIDERKFAMIKALPSPWAPLCGRLLKFARTLQDPALFDRFLRSYFKTTPMRNLDQAARDKLFEHPFVLGAFSAFVSIDGHSDSNSMESSHKEENAAVKAACQGVNRIRLDDVVQLRATLLATATNSVGTSKRNFLPFGGNRFDLTKTSRNYADAILKEANAANVELTLLGQKGARFYIFVVPPGSLASGYLPAGPESMITRPSADAEATAEPPKSPAAVAVLRDTLKSVSKMALAGLTATGGAQTRIVNQLALLTGSLAAQHAVAKAARDHAADEDRRKTAGRDLAEGKAGGPPLGQAYVTPTTSFRRRRPDRRAALTALSHYLELHSDPDAYFKAHKVPADLEAEVWHRVASKFEVQRRVAATNQDVRQLRYYYVVLPSQHAFASYTWHRGTCSAS